MGKILKSLKRLFHISDSHVKCDVLSMNYSFDEEINCQLILSDAEWDEKYLSAELYLCVGKPHDYKKYGETKISDSFVLLKGEEKKIDFNVLIPSDDFLRNHKKELFFIIEVHKNARISKKISKQLQIK